MKNSKFLQLAKNVMNSPYFIPAILFCLAVFFFPLKAVSPIGDSMWYLNKAMLMYKHFNLNTIIVRRAVFPFLMAISFRIFGPSVESGFYVVRLFFVLNILLCYFAGQKFYNKATGLAFSLLVFTSFTINRCSSLFMLDNIVPFPILLFMLITYLAVEKSKSYYFIISGVILAIAVSVKGEIAFMFVPLPICLLIFRKYRTRRNIKGIGLLYLLFILIISPWIYRIVLENVPSRVLLGNLVNFGSIKQFELIPSTSELAHLRSAWGAFSKHLLSFRGFIDRYISNQFVLSRLFLGGLIYSFYSAIRRNNRATTLLLVGIFLFLPIVAVVGRSVDIGKNMRTGHLMILYFLLHLMTANLLINFPKQLIETKVLRLHPYKLKNVLLKIFTISIVSTCLFLQIFVGSDSTRTRNFHALMTGRWRKQINCFSFYKGEFTVGGQANKTVREASKWIMENIPNAANILSQGEYSVSIDFHTERKYALRRIRNIYICPERIDKIPIDKLGKPLFVWLRRNRLVGQFENRLLKQIHNRHADYIVVTLRQNFLSLYLENNPNFSLIKSFSNGKIRIYQVEKLPVTPRGQFPLRFERKTYGYLRTLFQKSPHQYKWLKENLGKLFLWSDDETHRFFAFIESGNKKGFWENYESVQKWRIY